MKSTVCLVLTVLLAHCGMVHAQDPRGSRASNRSARVSPYVNLLRRDASAGVLYLGEIRPQIQMRRQLQSQQQSLFQLYNAQRSLAAGWLEPAATGHPTYFEHYGGYYNYGSQRTGLGSLLKAR